MRYFFTSVFITFALVAGTSAIAPIAHAQYYDAFGNSYSTQAEASAADAAGNTAASAAAAKTPVPPPAPTFDTGDLFAKVMTWVASIFAFLLSIAVITLNVSVYYTVVVMGNYVHNLSAVGVTWRILRDIGNIMLIFGFIAAGLMTILNVNWYGWGTKMLPKLLLAAVFLNFSLFFAEAIIDTGNLFATQFYAQINGGHLPGPGTLPQEGISDKIMQQLGMQQIYSGVRTDPQILMHNNPLFVGFMSIILFIVVAFVMFSLAFMLIARFVVLIILIIVAPIGFAGWAVPKLEGIASKWWDMLLKQTFTAPVLLLLLYVALAVITDAQFLSFGGSSGGTPSDWLGIFKGTGTDILGYASILLSFLVAMGLLLVVLMVAKSMSAVGASWATKTAGGLTFGTTAWLGRNTGGWAANKSAKFLRRTPIAHIPLIGTGAVKGLEKVASSNFDLRSSTAGGAALKVAKVDAGTAFKGGYKEELKKNVESRTKYAAELKGKEFKDLTAQQQVKFGNQENEIARLKKEKTNAQKADTLTPEKLKYYNEAVDRAETELDKMHKEAGTERGNKLKYAGILGSKPLSILSSNSEAAKKIKDEAKKSKDDKDLEALRKALKKAGGEEEGEGKKEEKKAEDAVPKGGGGEAAH